jgi:hypothetical protein
MSENWKISGTYFEACSCDIACPCVFLSAPTNRECNALAGWHIDQGNLQMLSLTALMLPWR